MHFYPNDTSNAADVAAAQRGYGMLLCSSHTPPPIISAYISFKKKNRLFFFRAAYIFHDRLLVWLVPGPHLQGRLPQDDERHRRCPSAHLHPRADQGTDLEFTLVFSLP